MPKRRETQVRREPVPAQTQADTRAAVAGLRREPDRPTPSRPATSQPSTRPAEAPRSPAPVSSRPRSLDELDVPEFLK